MYQIAVFFCCYFSAPYQVLRLFYYTKYNIVYLQYIQSLLVYFSLKMASCFHFIVLFVPAQCFVHFHAFLENTVVEMQYALLLPTRIEVTADLSEIIYYLPRMRT